MDEYTSRKGSGLVLRESSRNRDQNSQFSTRPSCNGRLNSMKATEKRCTEKARSSRPSFRSSSNGKEIIESSSRACPAVLHSRNSFTVPRKKLSSLLETDSSETSSVQDESEVSELTPSPGKIQREVHKESRDFESEKIVLVDEGNSSVASTTRSHRILHKKSGLGTEASIMGTSKFLASKTSGQPTRANASGCLRNIQCNSNSDVIPSGCLSSDSSLSRKKNLVKKRNCEGESSSSTSGQKMIGLSPEAQYPSSSHGISISDSRHAKNCSANRNNDIPSVRTRRSVNGYTRASLSNQGNRNNISQNESPVVMSQMSQVESPIDGSVPCPLHQFSEETSSNQPNSHSRPGGRETLHTIMLAALTEDGTRSVINQDNFQQYNLDGIAEVLLALERIERDVELSYQQLAVLETNLFLNSLNFYDQHRDMRLDIDNMSYEELLALEERMGSVSTALTEEMLSECLERSFYKSMLPGYTISGFEHSDDIKCSICQEEYVIDDEMGSLKCEHEYHLVCIQNWLQLKNWCPICKVPAAPVASLSPAESHQ